MAKQQEVDLPAFFKNYETLIDLALITFSLSVKANPEKSVENREATLKSIMQIIKERDNAIKVFKK